MISAHNNLTMWIKNDLTKQNESLDKTLFLVLTAKPMLHQCQFRRVPALCFGRVLDQLQDIPEDATVWIGRFRKCDAVARLFNLVVMHVRSKRTYQLAVDPNK